MAAQPGRTNTTCNFSLLPGTDRVFTLASPGPVVMTVGREERTLQQGQKIAFAGETAVTVKLASDEPQLGLNLMTDEACATEMSFLTFGMAGYCWTLRSGS